MLATLQAAQMWTPMASMTVSQVQYNSAVAGPSMLVFMVLLQA
jgi:hypothetical protein